MEREKEVKKRLETASVYSNSIASNRDKKLTLEETEEILKIEKERHERLIGQLKAAEARNRYLLID